MWYYMINGVQNGPFSEQDIVANIKAGIITRSTLIRGENDNVWDRITQNPCFSSYFHANVKDNPPHQQPQTFGQQNSPYQFDNYPSRNDYVNTTSYQPQSSSPQMASPQMGMPQMGMPQMGAPQMGAPQMGMPQMGAPQMGAPQMGAPQMGTPQMGMPQMGTPQMGMTQMGTPQMGTPQMGMPQMGTPQMGASQMGSPQMSAPQMGMPQMGMPQMGAPQMGTLQMASPYSFSRSQYNFSSNNSVNPVNSVSPAAPTPTSSYHLAERTEPLLPPTPAEAYHSSKSDESADPESNSVGPVNNVATPVIIPANNADEAKEKAVPEFSLGAIGNKLNHAVHKYKGRNNKTAVHSSQNQKETPEAGAPKKKTIKDYFQNVVNYLRNLVNYLRNLAKQYPYAFIGVSSVLLILVLLVGGLSLRHAFTSGGQESGEVSVQEKNKNGKALSFKAEKLPPGKIRVVLDDVRTMGERPEKYIEQYGLDSLTTRNFWGNVYSSTKSKNVEFVNARDGIIAIANKNGIVHTNLMSFQWVESNYGGKSLGRSEEYRRFKNGEWMMCASNIRFPRICCQKKVFNSYHNCAMIGVNTSVSRCPYVPNSAYLMNKDRSFSHLTKMEVIRKLYNEGYAIFVPEGTITKLLLCLKMDPLIMRDIQIHSKHYYVDVYIQNVHYKDLSSTTLYSFRKLFENYGDCSALQSDGGACTQLDKPWEGYVGTIAAVQVRNKFSDKIVAAAYSDGRKIKTELVDVNDVIREDLWSKDKTADNEDNYEDQADVQDE